MGTTCVTVTPAESACLMGGGWRSGVRSSTARSRAGWPAKSVTVGADVTPGSSPGTVGRVRVHPEDHRFHIGVAIFGYICALSFALIGALIVVLVSGYGSADPSTYPLWLVAITQIPQWVGMVGVCWFASRTWGTGNLRNDYGLRFRFSDAVGFLVGIVLQLVFVKALYKILGPLYRVIFRATHLSWFDISKLDEPAKQLTAKGRGLLGVSLLILVVVVGAPVFEEIFFRGLVLRSFAARYNDGLALVGSALMFATIHWQPLQLPALLMFGLVVGYAAQRTGRLGLGMAIHAGFNATAVATLLFFS